MIKQILLAFFFGIAATFCTAQTSSEIKYADSSSLFINGLLLNNATTFKKITEKLGEPDKKVDYPNSQSSYFYEDKGLLIMVKDSTVKGIGVNFNWDGDKKFPQKTYTGTLAIGELSITRDTKIENIIALKKIEMGCPMSILCASKSRAAKVQCTVAFDENKLLTQIIFVLK